MLSSVKQGIIIEEGGKAMLMSVFTLGTKVLPINVKSQISRIKKAHYLSNSKQTIILINLLGYVSFNLETKSYKVGLYHSVYLRYKAE